MTIEIDHARRANDVFAAFYDDFTADHRPAEWTACLHDVAIEAGLRGCRLLDVACGTGNSFVPMLERGYSVTACDISPGMAAVARAKSGGAADVQVHDMRALPRLGTFDLAWCLIDALNYLQSEEELAATFAGIRRNLAADGVLVFDVNTLGTFRSVYSSLLVRPQADRVLVLDGQGSPELRAGGSAEVWIDRLAAGRDGRWARERSVHHHRHHPLDELCAALAAGGMAPVAVYGSEPTGVLEPHVDELRHFKAVFIARPMDALEAGERR